MRQISHTLDTSLRIFYKPEYSREKEKPLPPYAVADATGSIVKRFFSVEECRSYIRCQVTGGYKIDTDIRPFMFN